MSTLIRAVDADGDWQFGAGLNDYKQNLLAVAQDIQNNLNMFLGDCFFATNVGIDWFNLLGGKDQTAINLAVNAAILNTSGVTGLLQVNTILSETRVLTLQYNVNTVYGVLQGTFTYDTGTL